MIKWTEKDVNDTVRMAMMPSKPTGVKDLVDKNSYLMKNNFKNKKTEQKTPASVKQMKIMEG